MVVVVMVGEGRGGIKGIDGPLVIALMVEEEGRVEAVATVEVVVFSTDKECLAFSFLFSMEMDVANDVNAIAAAVTGVSSSISKGWFDTVTELLFEEFNLFTFLNFSMRSEGKNRVRKE